MTMSMTMFIPLMFIFLTTALVLQYKHLLMSLFCLEAMMLSIIMLIPILTLQNEMNSTFSILILLTMGACEASLGLSIMVNMARSFGSDAMMLSTTNKC